MASGTDAARYRVRACDPLGLLPSLAVAGKGNSPPAHGFVHLDGRSPHALRRRPRRGPARALGRGVRAAAGQRSGHRGVAVRAVHRGQRGAVRSAGDRRAGRGHGRRGHRPLPGRGLVRADRLVLRARGRRRDGDDRGRERPHARPDRPRGVRPARGDDRARRERQRTGSRTPARAWATAARRARSSPATRSPRASRPTIQVLVQVGRRGAAGTPDDERAVLSLRVAPIPTFTPVLGDRAEPLTPVARAKRPTEVPLANATITRRRRRDAALPEPRHGLAAAHPRRQRPAARLRVRRRRVHARRLRRRPARLRPPAGLRHAGRSRPDGDDRPRAQGADDVDPRRHRRPAGEPRDAPRRQGRRRSASSTAAPAASTRRRAVPAGGLPAACDRPKIEQARIAGPRFSGPPGRYNVRACRSPSTSAARRVVPCRAAALRPARPPLRQGRCSGSSRRASAPSGSAGSGRSSRGRYRLELTGLDRLGERVKVRGNVQGRLR